MAGLPLFTFGQPPEEMEVTNMNLPSLSTEPASEIARRRLLSRAGDPFLFADWERVVFLHFLIKPDLIPVPEPLELETFQGEGCLSLACVSMCRFRPARRLSLGWLAKPIREQRFLNLRTYVRYRGEPGALFLWGWLSKPFPVPLPSGLFRLPYQFASLRFALFPEEGRIRGEARSNGNLFAFRASLCAAAQADVGRYIPNEGPLQEANTGFVVCPAGSLAEFAMERYTGFFCRGASRYLFDVWHPSWRQAPLDMTIEDASLVERQFSWFAQARFAAANFAPGFRHVWLGRAHDLNRASPIICGHHALSRFYEMP
jgi:uncharacterized protein YqjF (DUF2071 family)